MGERAPRGAPPWKPRSRSLGRNPWTSLNCFHSCSPMHPSTMQLSRHHQGSGRNLSLASSCVNQARRRNQHMSDDPNKRAARTTDREKILPVWLLSAAVTTAAVATAAAAAAAAAAAQASYGMCQHAPPCRRLSGSRPCSLPALGCIHTKVQSSSLSRKARHADKGSRR